MSFYDDMRYVVYGFPSVSSLGFADVGVEIPADWFVRYDIKPRGVKSPTRMTYWVSVQQLHEISLERPGVNRASDVGYRWKEVY